MPTITIKRSDFNPDQQSDIAAKHVDHFRKQSTAFSKLKASDIGAHCFDDFAKKKLSDVTACGNVPTPDGNTTIHRKLVDSDSAAAKMIKEALQPTPEFLTAKTRYHTCITTCQELAKGKETFQPSSFLEEFKTNNDRAIKAIQKQHAEEQTKLSALFDQNTFKTSLRQELTPLNAEQLPNIKAAMLQDLKNTQKKQLDEFQKNTTQSLKNLHDAAREEARRFLWLATISNDPSVQKHFREVNKENNGNQADAEATVGTKPNHLLVKMDQIKKIDTRTSKFLSNVSISFAENTITCKLPTVFYGNENRSRDFRIMAEAARAKGWKKIDLTLDGFASSDVAKQRAREAYIACIDAGYPVKDINIKIGGQKTKVEDVFEGGHQQTLSELQKASPENIKAKNTALDEFLKKKFDSSEQRALRKKLAEMNPTLTLDAEIEAPAHAVAPRA